MAAEGRRSWRGGKGSGKGASKGGGGKGGWQKPSDSPDFVRWSKGMRLQGSSSGVSYIVEDYVGSGSFSRVFRVRAEKESPVAIQCKRRWGSGGAPAEADMVFAAKVMRKQDAYIQYTSDGPKEGELLMRLEAAQREAGAEVLTMRCLDSFATKDDAGGEYWCLILEWLDASLFDVVRANRNQGLHLSMVRSLLKQLLEQLRVIQSLGCTHTDIKHKNCCLASTEHFMAPVGQGESSTLILTRPLAKLIDYGNAVFEGSAKPHPIHTKQFRAPEVLLNVQEGWGPPSDTWTLGITAAYLVSGQLIFNSHDPQELVKLMVQALGPFPGHLLGRAKDRRLCRVAESASEEVGNAVPQLAIWLGLSGKGAAETACADLLLRMLALDPGERISAEAALRHSFIVEGGDGATATVPLQPSSAILQRKLS